MQTGIEPSTVRHIVRAPAFFALVGTVLVCSLRGVLGNGDTYTHIAAGTWLLDHLRLPDWDPIGARLAGQPWMPHEWLSEVLLAGSYRLAGLNGVVLLAAGVVAGTFANLARHIGRNCDWSGTMLLTTAALLCSIPSLTVRPHLLALPCLELWAAEMVFARAQRRAPSFWLLPVMVLWANLHGGSAVGLVLVGLFTAEASWSGLPSWRRWWLFAAAALLAASLTPAGVDGVLFPWRLVQMRSLDGVQEWRPTDFARDPAFELVVLALIGMLATGRLRLAPCPALLMLGLLHAALLHSRHGVLFGIIGALLLAEPLGRAFRRGVTTQASKLAQGLCWTATALTLAVRVATPLPHLDGEATPVSALAQLPPGLTDRPVLNSLQFGGYLSLVGFRPFVDGRSELFGDDVIAAFRDMSELSGGKLRRRLDEQGIDWAILAPDDPLTARFEQMAGWHLRYADAVSRVFVRDAGALSRHWLASADARRRTA